jgi:hypothetical protein
MTITEKREVFNAFIGDLGVSFDSTSAVEVLNGLDDGDEFSVEVDGGDYRLIREGDIDKIMEDELDDDHYMLGCCSAWFIADITGLTTEDVEKAQKADSMKVLGALMAKDLELVQQRMASEDGYGHYFNHYDGNEYEAGGWYIFRTN